MLDENKHIDSLFADGLKGMSVEPKPEVWNAISGKMLAARRKRRGVIVFISAALAASVLLFFGIQNRNLFISEPGLVPMQQLSDQVSETNQAKNTDKTIETETATAEQEEVMLSKESVQDFVASNELFAGRNITKETTVVHDNRLQKESIMASIPMSVGVLSNSANTIPESLQYIGVDKLSVITLSAEDLIVMNNLMAMEQAKKDELRKNRWAIIGQITSAYSNEESAASANSGIVSFGGGVKVNYALGEKLAFQTGFMYNRIGQDFGGGSQNLVFSDANALEGSNKDEGASYGLEVLPSNSTAGNIRYKNLETRDASQAEYLLTSNFGSSEELMQSFETIEVPFLLRYSLSQKRLGVYVSGGFGANWIIDNGVYRTSGSKQKIGEIDNLRTTNFSSLFGLGFEYNLSPKIQIGLEPSFKYYLNSINKSSEFNYKPYSIGIHTGIRYNF
ncbi:outer membrane beta-barrel protein [Marinifilum caeruleilacunae]|uniref:Outer membrane protein beta-barrel domain-containing protein n=1 Tax=Marinifilum caeruleilacunae TaxID=2499076 RepID=A0ABX1WS78_9BACT|nr:outer membrane beta-barrel protein [Marinifilum caeruleilacunae]NOU58931.1 hypothetical protein [Marinifilum caeruleilacunae]